MHTKGRTIPPIWKVAAAWATFLWLLLACTATSAQTSALPLRVYVSPQGDDHWSGRSEQTVAASGQGPLKTWLAAQVQVRLVLASMRSGAQPRQPIQVIFLPGNYSLDQEIKFSAEDSGETDAPVTFAARVPGTVHVSGGRQLIDGGHTATAIILAGLPSKWTAADPGQLFVNSQRATLARQPNIGQEWFVDQSAWLSGEAGDGIGKGGLIPSPDAKKWIDRLSLQERQRAIINLYQSWTNGFHHMSAEDSALALRLSPPAYWPARNFGASQRFHIENIPSALDAPGEWIGDDARITYLLRPQELPADASRDAILAVLDRLIIFEDASAGAVAHDIRFEGLVFEHARQSIPSSGLLDVQAAVGVGAAIEVNRAERIIFDHCTVQHTGGYGIWFRNNVRNSRVLNSNFEDLGAGGIKIGAVSRQGDGLPTGMNEASGNSVQHTGQIVAGAAAIWIGASWDNAIKNNLIAHTTYSGISVGWKWGYGEPSAGRNIISANLLYNIGQAMMADLGGIYTLGPSPGTVISANVIREVHGYKAYGAGAWGIYNDEGSSQILVENNVIVGTDSGGYHLHYGRANMVRSNIFVGGQQAEIRVTKGDPSEISVTFENNQIELGANQPLAGSFDEHNTIFRGNRFSSMLGQPLHLERCGQGCETAVLHVAADMRPRHIQIDGLDAESASRWQNIINQAGPAALSEQQLGQVDLHLPAPPVAGSHAFFLDLDGVPVGGRPLGLTYYAGKDKPWAIAAALPSDRPGRKCLKFVDSADGPRYEPFAFTRLDHQQGYSIAEFDLWVDDRVEFIHEWRDVATPYHVGPSVQVTPRGVLVNGRIVSPVKPYSWLHVLVRAALGSQAGRWDLDITGGAEVHLRQIEVAGQPGTWQKLEWLGFISNTAGPSEFCLAGLSAKPF